MTKRVYMSTLNDHINQHLTNVVVNKKLLSWDNNNFYKYKTIYLLSEIQLFKSDFAISQLYKV